MKGTQQVPGGHAGGAVLGGPVTGRGWCTPHEVSPLRLGLRQSKPRVPGWRDLSWAGSKHLAAPLRPATWSTVGTGSSSWALRLAGFFRPAPLTIPRRNLARHRVCQLWSWWRPLSSQRKQRAQGGPRPQADWAFAREPSARTKDPQLRGSSASQQGTASAHGSRSWQDAAGMPGLGGLD